MCWMSDLAETELKSRDWNPSQLALYFALAYGFSLALWLPMLLGRSHSSFSFSIGTFGPTLAALASTAETPHATPSRNLGRVVHSRTAPQLRVKIQCVAWDPSLGRTAGRGVRLARICSPEISAPLQSAGVFSHPWVSLGQLASSVDACSRL
jgi:hypothetical protein